jgi:hypothetical protein
MWIPKNYTWDLRQLSLNVNCSVVFLMPIIDVAFAHSVRMKILGLLSQNSIRGRRSISGNGPFHRHHWVFIDRSHARVAGFEMIAYRTLGWPDCSCSYSYEVLAEDDPEEICPIDAGTMLPDIVTKTLSGGCCSPRIHVLIMKKLWRQSRNHNCDLLA